MRLCVIPARGGSKRIPHKNIKDFCGKPLIAYSIEAAVNSGVFDEVIVSTDDENIAKIAREFGVKTPFMREANLSDDFATTSDVMKDAVLKMSENFQTICCLYATAQILTSVILREANERFQAAG